MHDTGLPRREQRLRELGLTTRPDPELDVFAADLAAALGQPYAMVNLITDAQHFAGLHTPDPSSPLPPVGRTMSRDHGYCPEVLTRRLPLVLPDVYANPRFASNAVVDLIGIRTYAGAPLITADGVALGTICVIGTAPSPLADSRATLALIKNRRDSLMDLIQRRT
ncbi:GAF domain-containing protein [Streptomyces sp. NPDC095613]|uniref:GAF domain-containing protein n=1 Tax=Streptomyces sp. NPDC095613 TaxID=3155540 RepID=UPI00332F0BC8